MARTMQYALKIRAQADAAEKWADRLCFQLSDAYQAGHADADVLEPMVDHLRALIAAKRAEADAILSAHVEAGRLL